MKVGYVVRYWPTASETFVAREIEGLLARGIDVDVAALGRREAGGETPPVEVFRPPTGRRRVASLTQPRGWPAAARLWRWQRGKDALGRAPWLRALAARRGWARAHVHFAGEALEVAVAALRMLPLSVTVHAVDLFRPRPSLRRLLGHEHLAVLTVCEHHRRWLAERYGVAAVVVRCGVDPARYRAAPGPQGGRRVLCVARDVPKKGLDALRAAVLSLPDATLRLTAGRASLAHPRVTLGAAVPADPLFREADVFALASRVAPDGDRDGVPVALMEAMASGLPVVTTAVSGIPELVDDEVGWLVPPDDLGALRAALSAALDDPTEGRRRGAAGRARVAREWTVEHQVDGLLRAWGHNLS